MPPNNLLLRAVNDKVHTPDGRARIQVSGCAPHAGRAAAEQGRYAARSIGVLAIMLLLFSPGAESQEAVIGLVEIPDLAVPYPPNPTEKPPSATVQVLLREQARSNASVVLTVHNWINLEFAEQNEKPSAYAYGREFSEGTFWYKLRYKVDDRSGFAWMKAAAPNRFHSTADLIRENLPHMTNEWDGRLFDAPNLDATSRSVPKRWDESHAGARLIDVWNQGSELWYLVAVIRGGICSGEPPEVISTGWVPANVPSGRSPIWYYSRGC